MESLAVLVTDMAMILIVASIMTILCKLLKQPLIIGYVLAGLLLSPLLEAFPWQVGDTGEIEILGEIGVIFLMFSLGLEFNLHKMVEVGVSGILGAVVQIVGMVLLGYMVGLLLGWSTLDSLFLGGMLSMSSTIITVKAIEDCKMTDKPFSSLAVGTLVIEDIAAIFLMLVLSTVSVSQGSNAGMVLTIGKLLFYLALWLILGILLLPTLFQKINKLLSGESLLIVSLGICFLMVLLADALGFSTALGAFMAGSLLAGTAASGEIEHLLTPCKDLFVAIFFVSVGFLVVPATLLDYIIPILILVVVSVLGKIVLLTFSYLVTGQNIDTSLHCSFCQTQVGEFSFVIAALGLSLGVTGEFLYPVIVAVALLTTFTTPFLLRTAAPCSKFLEKKLPPRITEMLSGKKEEESQEKDLESSDLWKRYLKHCGFQIGIFTLIGVGVVVIGNGVLVPLVQTVVPGNWGRIIVMIILFIVMLPVIPQLMNTHDPDFAALWLANKKNRFPLSALVGVRVAVAMGLLLLIPVVLFNEILYWWLLLLIPFAVLVGRSKKIRGSYLTIKAQFMANLNEQQLRETAENSGILWHDDNLLVDTYVLPDDSFLEGKMLSSVNWGRILRLNVIRIERGKKIINLPERDTVFKVGDVIYLYGRSDDLQRFRMVFDSGEVERKNQGDVTFYGFITEGQDLIAEKDQMYCYGVSIHKESPFASTLIRDTRLKEDYNCFIVGVERDLLPISNVNPDFILQPGDLVWILGTSGMIWKLIQDDVVTPMDKNTALPEMTENE